MKRQCIYLILLCALYAQVTADKEEVMDQYDPSTGALVRLKGVELFTRTKRTQRDTQVRSRGSTFRTIEREETDFDPLTQQRTHKVTLPPSFKRPQVKSNNSPNEAVPRSPGSSESPFAFGSTTQLPSLSVDRVVPSSCLEPVVQGPCLARFQRYHYNPYTQKCHSFTYSGCMGNANNFLTPELCVRSCKAKGVIESSLSIPVET